jgi:hypothetical protein
VTKKRRNAFRVPSVEKLSVSLYRLSVSPPLASFPVGDIADKAKEKLCRLRPELLRENDAEGDGANEEDGRLNAALDRLPRLILPIE